MTEQNWADSSKHYKRKPNTVSVLQLAKMDGEDPNDGLPPMDLNKLLETGEPTHWSESEGRKPGTVSGIEHARAMIRHAEEKGIDVTDTLPPTDLTEGKTRLVIPTSKPRDPRVPTLENSATLRIGEKLATSEIGFRAPVRSEDWY